MDGQSEFRVFLSDPKLLGFDCDQKIFQTDFSQNRAKPPDSVVEFIPRYLTDAVQSTINKKKKKEIAILNVFIINLTHVPSLCFFNWLARVFVEVQLSGICIPRICW